MKKLSVIILAVLSFLVTVSVIDANAQEKNGMEGKCGTYVSVSEAIEVKKLAEGQVLGEFDGYTLEHQYAYVELKDDEFRMVAALPNSGETVTLYHTRIDAPCIDDLYQKYTDSSFSDRLWNCEVIGDEPLRGNFAKYEGVFLYMRIVEGRAVRPVVFTNIMPDREVLMRQYNTMPCALAAKASFQHEGHSLNSQ